MLHGAIVVVIGLCSTVKCVFVGYYSVLRLTPIIAV